MVNFHSDSNYLKLSNTLNFLRPCIIIKKKIKITFYAGFLSLLSINNLDQTNYLATFFFSE